MLSFNLYSPNLVFTLFWLLVALDQKTAALWFPVLDFGCFSLHSLSVCQELCAAYQLTCRWVTSLARRTTFSTKVLLSSSNVSNILVQKLIYQWGLSVTMFISSNVSKKRVMIGSEIDQMTNDFLSVQSVLFECLMSILLALLVNGIFPEKVPKYLLNFC